MDRLINFRERYFLYLCIIIQESIENIAPDIKKSLRERCLFYIIQRQKSDSIYHIGIFFRKFLPIRYLYAMRRKVCTAADRAIAREKAVICR